jgi:hypothetical protein
MKMAQARRYRGFSPEAQAVIEARAVEGAWELRRLLRLLEELTHFDETNEAAARKARNAMVWCIVLGVVSLILAFLLFGGGLEWVWLAPLAMAALAVYFGRKWRGLKKLDLIDDFRLCLMPALRDLAQDVDAGQRIRVRMNLAGPVASKVIADGNVDPGRNISVKETVYEDPWGEVRLPLVDGSTAVLEFKVWWTKRERKYRASGGKVKLKTKWRKRCAAVATLLPPGARGWDEAALKAWTDGRKEKVQMVWKEGLTGARLERHWVFKAVGGPPGDAPPAREVVGMLLRLYGAMRGGSEVAR